jgi:hypothetical protein
MYRAAVKDAGPRLVSFLKTLAATPNVATLPIHQTAVQELFATSPLRSHVGNSIGETQIFRRFQLFHSNQQLLQTPAAIWSVRTLQKLRTCAFQAVVDKPIGQSPFTHRIAYGTVREQHSSATPQAEGAAAPQAATTVQSESGGGGGQKSDGGARKGFFANLQDVPLVPLLLGFAGAIPFVALAPPVAPLLPLPVSFLKGLDLFSPGSKYVRCSKKLTSLEQLTCGTVVAPSLKCKASGLRIWFKSKSVCTPYSNRCLDGSKPPL